MEAGSGTTASATARGKTARPFLRRGEGVEKRVFASRYRKATTPAATGTGSSNDSTGGDIGANSSEDVGGRRGDQHRLCRTPTEQPYSDAWAWEGKTMELASETQLLSVEQPPDKHLDAGPLSSRFLRNSVKVAWATQQAEEEMELEEFRALETQIKADVVGGARSRHEQAAQALPSSSAHLPAAPVRSYAAIHQHRPPQPPQAQRSAGRSNDRPAANAGQTRVSAGWSSPQPNQSQRYQQDAFDVMEGDGAADDDGYAGGLDFEPELPYNDVGAGSPWDQQHFSPGKPASVAARDSLSRGRGGGGHGTSPAWGLGTAEAGPLASVKSGSGRGFDDLDAWNDTAGFGGAGPCVRKGAGAPTTAAAVASAGSGNVRGAAFHVGSSQSPPAAQLEDPWAAPAGGDGLYGTRGDIFPDDCNGWSADQQQKPQLKPSGAKPDDDERGPDQPFVRALFNKQRQPQHGAGRGPGKAAGGAGGKAKAAEPAGPSPAELERLRALEEQLTSVSSERSTLVRMRTELEKAANRLEQERQAWEKSRAEEQAKWDAQKDAEESRLRRDRRVLEKQSKALLKLPNKKERSAMEAAEAALEAERREGRAREARHKLTVERLRRQLVEQQERNLELREEVRWHEAQQLERGWPPGGAGAGGAKGSQQTKPRPSRSAGVQTEPLPFLPPLEGVTAAPDAAAVRRSTPAGVGTLRPGAAAAAAAAGSRPRSSGSSLSAGGGGASGPAARLRALQASRLSATPGRLQQQPQNTWRADKAWPLSGRGVEKAHGAAQRWQAGDDEEEEEVEELPEEGDGEEAEQASFGQRHRRGQQAGLRSEDPSPWWQGGGEQTDGADEDGAEEDDDAPVRPGSAAWRGSGPAGTSRVSPRGRGKGDSAAAVAAGSPSSYSYVQNDDAEVLTDEGGGGDGLDSDSLSAMAWQQHQEFMARMGLAPDGLSTQPVFDRPFGGEQRQPQQQSQWQHQGGRGEDDMNGPSTSGRQRQQQQHQQQQHQQQQHQQQQHQQQQHQQQQHQQQQHQQQQHQQQQNARTGPPQLTRSRDAVPSAAGGAQRTQSAQSQRHPSADANPAAGAGPFAQAPAAWRQNELPGNVRSGAGGPSTTSAFFGGSAGAQSHHRAAANGAPAGPRSGAAAAARSQVPAAPGQGQPAAANARESIVDLDGVSQTLAALRMDRNLEATVAATRGGGGGGGGGLMGSGPPSAMSPPSGFSQAAPQQLQAQPWQQEGRPQLAGSRDPWSADSWSPPVGSSGPARLPADSRHQQGAPTAWGPAQHAPADAWGSGDGALRQPQHLQHQQQHQQQRQPQQHYQQQHQQQQRQSVHEPQALSRQPYAHQAGGFGGFAHQSSVMNASAANAASVAQVVASQQQQHDAPMPRTAMQAAAPGAGGGGGADAMLREVQHSDGKVERLYASGKRLVLFANGTRKVAMSDGSSRVYFANGDIKWAVPAPAAAAASSARDSPSLPSPPAPGIGVVHYYYAEVATWHSTYGGEGGVEVFYFPSGQTEAHHPGHGKEILFPDGVLRVVTADGEEVDVSWQQLSWAIQQPQPRVDDLGDDDL